MKHFSRNFLFSYSLTFAAIYGSSTVTLHAQEPFGTSQPELPTQMWAIRSHTKQVAPNYGSESPFYSEASPVLQLQAVNPEQHLIYAQAQDEAAKEVPLSEAEELAALKERLKVLEDANAARTKKEKEAKEKSEKEKEEADKAKDDWTDLSSEKWTVKLGGHIQMDYVNWADADPAIVGAQNYFSYRRLRLVADGTGYGVYDFRLQMTLEPGQDSNTDQFGSPDVKDAYVSMNEIPGLGRVRVGNFFVPFSLEQVTNDTNNIFHERSIPTQGIFAADREVGIAVYNCTQDQNTSWATGLFFDEISDAVKTRVDNNQGYRLSGRLNWLPYYDEPSNGRYLVHTGVGVLHTDDYDDRVRFRARPQLQRGPVLIDTANLPADSYTTGNLELAIVWGAITWQNEAFLSNVNMNNGNNVHVGGAYSHLSWFLTGENRVYERFGQHGAQFGRNRPFTNFFGTPGGWGWGAWEAKTRWSYLDLTSANRGNTTI